MGFLNMQYKRKNAMDISERLDLECRPNALKTGNVFVLLFLSFYNL